MKTYQRLFLYIKKHPFYLFSSLICALVFIISTVIMPLMTGKMVDTIKNIIFININDTYYNLLINQISFTIVLIALTLLFQFVFEYLVGIFVEKITKEIKDDLFTKINNVSINYIDNHSHGDLLNRCVVDTENINNALISGFKQFYQGIIQVLSTLIIMFLINWILGLTVIILTPLNFFASYSVSRHSKKNINSQTKEQGILSSIVVEDFENINVIKSFNYQNEAFNKFQNENNKLYSVGQKAQFVSTLTNPTTRLINNMSYGIVGMIAGILCALSANDNYIIFGASCTIGTILTFVQYSTQFAKPFNEISSCLNEIQTGISSMRRVNEVLNEENDIDTGLTVFNYEINSINFNNVFFSYTPGTNLIENFNLSIKSGQKIAIVGPTGCGKTTMINLLLRFYDCNRGNISLNNVNIKDITKKSLRSQFGMVLQDTWIFNGTVLDNIKYAKPDATMEEVIEASKKANAYNFINHLPKGFHTRISDSSGLSIGEKQLICIARVILSDSKIMILDEATSNIDTRSELKISNAFNNMMKGKTSFIIAHRLSTIKNSDLIIVMRDGHIIETGKHDELLSKKGFYYNLYTAQYSK